MLLMLAYLASKSSYSYMISPSLANEKCNLLLVAVEAPSALQAGIPFLGEYFYGEDGITASIVSAAGLPFFTTYNSDSIVYTTYNETQLTVTQQGGTFVLSFSEAPTVINSLAASGERGHLHTSLNIWGPTTIL